MPFALFEADRIAGISIFEIYVIISMFYGVSSTYIKLVINPVARAILALIQL